MVPLAQAAAPFWETQDSRCFAGRYDFHGRNQYMYFVWSNAICYGEQIATSTAEEETLHWALPPESFVPPDATSMATSML